MPKYAVLITCQEYVEVEGEDAKDAEWKAYEVVFVSYGYVMVEADDEDQAIDLAYEQCNWDQFDIPEHIRVEELQDA